MTQNNFVCWAVGLKPNNFTFLNTGDCWIINWLALKTRLKRSRKLSLWLSNNLDGWQCLRSMWPTFAPVSLFDDPPELSKKKKKKGRIKKASDCSWRNPRTRKILTSIDARGACFQNLVSVSAWIFARLKITKPKTEVACHKRGCKRTITTCAVQKPVPFSYDSFSFNIAEIVIILLTLLKQ